MLLLEQVLFKKIKDATSLFFFRNAPMDHMCYFEDVFSHAVGSVLPQAIEKFLARRQLFGLVAVEQGS